MKILAIRYSGLADIIMLLSTLEKIKNKYENAHITLLTDSSNVKLKELSCGLIDEVITVNRGYFKRKEIFNSLSELVKVIFKIRSKFDMCIDFQSFGETATISYLANAKIKLGAPKKEKYNYGYTQIIQRDESGHRSQLFSRIATVNDNLNFSKLCLNNEAAEYKQTTLKRLNKDKKTIGLNIGSTQENRRWSENNFSQLSNILKENYNVLIFLGPSEIQYKDAFDKESLFIENVNLIELTGAISVCDIFITNDTGPAHMAAALNVSTLTLFSTGSDNNVGSLIDKKEFIKNLNINEISINQVEEKLNQLI
jgi:heptosyltransferase I